MKIFTKILFLSVLLAFASCQQNDAEPEVGVGEVQFSFEVADDQDASGGRTASNNPSQIVLTIQDGAGQVIYSQESLNVINVNGSFISEPLTLPTGSYQLTEYFVNDSDGNTIFIAPLAGSAVAYLVANPLPLGFSIAKDVASQLSPEVLSTAAATAEDFGYTGFELNLVNTFDFLMAVQVLNETTASFELTDANVEILGDGTSIFNQPVGAITNQITVPDGYTAYTVVTSKTDFVTNTLVLDNSTLKSHLNDPISVILDPVLVGTFDVYANENGVILGNGVSLPALESGESFHLTVEETDTWMYASFSQFTTNANGDVTQPFTLTPTHLPGLVADADFNVSALVASVDDGASYFFVGTDLVYENSSGNPVQIVLYQWDSTPLDNSGFVSVTVERN